MPEEAALCGEEQRRESDSRLPTGTPTAQYTIRGVQFPRLSADELREWKDLRCRIESSPYSHPEWMRGFFDESQLENLSVFLLYRDGCLEGVAPFLRLAWPLRCYLGPFQAASFPLVRLRLIGEVPDFPEKEEVYRLLLDHLERLAGVDAIFLEGVPVDSLLWRCVRDGEASKRFRPYEPTKPAPRFSIRISGTFESYMKSFSARHRHNLRRRVTKFQEESPEPVSWKKCTAPEDVDVFLRHALAVSRKSYQWKLFQRGLSDTGRLRRRLMFAAQNGWLRSYLLFAGDTPVAFVVGWQHHGCFEHHEIGYDPAWRRWAVGTVLHMHLLKDLFECSPPGVLDLGAQAVYKEEFSNHSYLAGTLFLFRRRSAYLAAVRQCHATLEDATAAVTRVLKDWRIASAVRRFVRR